MRFEVVAILVVFADGLNMEAQGKKPWMQQPVEARFSARNFILKAQQQIQAQPTNQNVLFKACHNLNEFANSYREGPGPYGGNRVSTMLLENGIGEALSLGLLHAVELDVAEHQSRPRIASMNCFLAITGLTVQNDYDKSLALINNAPNLWKSIVAFFRAFKGTPEVNDNMCSLAGLFGSPQPPRAAAAEVAAGGIDLVMEYFQDESIKSEPQLFHKVFCALSDPVHERSGVVARAIATHGGELQGIRLLVHAIHMAREAQFHFHKDNAYGLLYEGVQVIGGVMEHDNDKNFTNEFVRAGLVQEIVPIMQADVTDHMLQDMSCEAIKWLTDDKTENSVEVRDHLAEAGALELMAKALYKFTHPPIHGYAMVADTCSAALLNFALAPKNDFKDWLLSLGVLEGLNEETLHSYPITGKDEWNPRANDFRNYNIFVLKEVLGQHKAWVYSKAMKALQE